MSAFIDGVLRRAKAKNGVREKRDAAGNATNSGPDVDIFLRSVGLSPGFAWCAAFVYWAVSEEAKARQIDPPFIKSAYCPDIETWARTRHILHTTPKVGDAFLRILDGWSVHIGLVTEVHADGTFSTIEGNTNDRGSSEGDGVYVKRRPVSTCKFVRWADLLPPAVTEPAMFHLRINGKTVADMPQIEGRSWVALRDWASFWCLTLSWDAEERVAYLGGKLVKSQIHLKDGKAYARLNDLIQGTSLKSAVDVAGRTVTLTGGL
jgi:hypothetical protein